MDRFAPTGIRTPVTGLRTQRPRPLDDRSGITRNSIRKTAKKQEKDRRLVAVREFGIPIMIVWRIRIAVSRLSDERLRA